MPRPSQIQIEFFQGEVATDLPPMKVSDILLLRLVLSPQMGGSQPTRIGMHTFDLRRLESHDDGYITGEFVKFRRDFLPNVGALTRDERELDIHADEYLVEKNFFLYELDRQLLIYQKNGHGGSVLNLAAYLKRVYREGTVSFNPVLQPDPMKRLLRGGAMPRKLYLTAARPTNPDFVPQNEWTKAALKMLSSSGGIGFTLQLRADGHSKDDGRHLSGDVKRALAELIECGAAKTARIDIEEDGITHPIDLIADRLISTQDVEMAGRYPLKASIIPALYAAVEDKRRDLELIFGTAGRRLV